MARVAVVTGGTRGIGEAISKALKAAGYKVAASYAGNDEAAAKFKAETGIAVYNVTPYSIAPYFYKIECFCFTDEKLDPGEEAHMPVVFYIDQSMLDDAQARGYGRVTLSYTFFAQKPSAKKLDAARELNSGSKAEAADIEDGKPPAFDNDAPRS